MKKKNLLFFLLGLPFILLAAGCSDDNGSTDIDDPESIIGKWQDVTYVDDDWTCYYWFEKDGSFRAQEIEEGYKVNAKGTYTYSNRTLSITLVWSDDDDDYDQYDQTNFRVLSRDGKTMRLIDEFGDELTWKKR